MSEHKNGSKFRHVMFSKHAGSKFLYWLEWYSIVTCVGGVGQVEYSKWNATGQNSGHFLCSFKTSMQTDSSALATNGKSPVVAFKKAAVCVSIRKIMYNFLPARSKIRQSSGQRKCKYTI